MTLNGTWQQPVLEQIPDLDSPHPSTFAKVEVREMTPWMPADDAKPVPKSKEMSVRCCMAEEVVYDSYDGEVSVKPIVKHQFYSEKNKRWDRDVATTELSADRYLTARTQTAVITGIKDRFGSSIAQYERVLAKEGRPLPIVLLADKVYPAVINACESVQVASIQAFAAADKPTLAKIDAFLRKYGRFKEADNLKMAQDKAKERLASLGIEVGSKKAA
jgi:hypothetical protein